MILLREALRWINFQLNQGRKRCFHSEMHPSFISGTEPQMLSGNKTYNAIAHVFFILSAAAAALQRFVCAITYFQMSHGGDIHISDQMHSQKHPSLTPSLVSSEIYSTELPAEGSRITYNFAHVGMMRFGTASHSHLLFSAVPRYWHEMDTPTP